MIKSSTVLRSCSLPLVLEAKDVNRTRPSSSTKFASTVTCSSRNHSYIPKLEPFSRTKFERILKDPPLIEKSENELAGDESYGCWRAYFELKDLEKHRKQTWRS
uniref:Uncharacterized protein n=1 Tax=Cannabis sativa TaxID=3483 RepID=A0A803NPB5_CANSA